VTDQTLHTVLIQAPADRVYELVADPMRMREWSPECVGCRWIGDVTSAVPGARFRGTSRNGWRRWSTTSTIAAMRPSELFAWEVTYFGQPVARWEYRLEPDAAGVRLTETVLDRRGALLRRVSPFITGSSDRSKRNAETMQGTLEAIKAAAESTT
jgi:uncharacterized protein YndB with AHSA1/START domain